jgi:hypothetical protein
MPEVKIRLVASIDTALEVLEIEIASERWAHMDEDERDDYLSDALADHVSEVVDAHYEVEEYEGDDLT